MEEGRHLSGQYPEAKREETVPGVSPYPPVQFLGFLGRTGAAAGIRGCCKESRPGNEAGGTAFFGFGAQLPELQRPGKRRSLWDHWRRAGLY